MGSGGVPSVGAAEITSTSESEFVSPWRGPLPRLWSPSALMTSCASSSVGDQGRVLRGALRSVIVVSLCLRAGMRYTSAVALSMPVCCGPTGGVCVTPSV